MTDPAGPEAPPGAIPGQAPSPEAPPLEGERRVHLYEAASTQREQILSSFGEQRAAILKAVDDQRKAATAPIEAVRAKNTTNGFTQDKAPPIPQNAAANAANDLRYLAAQGLTPGAVAGQIVAVLKLMIAQEIKAQLMEIARSATTSDRTAASSPMPANPHSEPIL